MIYLCYEKKKKILVGVTLLKFILSKLINFQLIPCIIYCQTLKTRRAFLLHIETDYKVLKKIKRVTYVSRTILVHLHVTGFRKEVCVPLRNISDRSF